MLRDPRHVVEELRRRIGAKIGAGNLGRTQVRHQRVDVVDAVINDADRAGGKAAVAARTLLPARLRASPPWRRSCAASAAQSAALPAPTAITSASSACSANDHSAACAAPPWAFDQPTGSFMKASASCKPARVEPPAFLRRVEHVPPAGGERMQGDTEIAQDFFRRSGKMS